MSDNTKIVWCDSTFNPWIGCTKVGPGCDHCYAEADFDLRKHRAKWGSGNPRSRTSPANWKKPLQWTVKPFYECGCGYRGTMDELTTNAIHTCGEKFKRVRRRVFCASLADVFDNEVPRQWRVDLFRLILDTPNLDWLLLTKRIGNAAKMLQDAAVCIGPMMDASDRYKPLPNVWLGATICNQEEADRDIPKLLAVPATVRWLSMEPLLGPVDLTNIAPPVVDGREWHGIDAITPANRELRGCIDWVVVGGESGTNARPMHPEWAGSLRDQCAGAGVPFLFKQWGEWIPMMGHAESVPVRGPKFTHIDGTIMGRAGKQAAGRWLNGQHHNGYPKPQ